MISLKQFDKRTPRKFKDRMISLKQFDKHTPGKFKLEFIENGQICLNSMVYHAWNDTDEKTSCKGMQKRRNHLVHEHFLSVIETQKAKQFKNAGFIKKTDSATGYFYTKRKISSDGFSTTHIDI